MRALFFVGAMVAGGGALGLAAEVRAAAPAAPSAAPAAPTAPAAPATSTTTMVAPGTTVTWWGHASFVITTPGGAAIAIDPWIDNPNAPKGATPPSALDAILVTHGHFDHVASVVPLATKTGANVVAAFELANQLGVQNASTVTPGGSLRFKDATVRVVEAVHGSGFGPDPKNPRYGGPPVGYVIAIDKGPVIYHAGDTDAFSSMALIAERYKPTVALLPIGGHFTMDPAGAAVAAKLLKVKTVIPMHFGTFPLLKGTPDELRAALKQQHLGTKVVEMKPGETLKL